VPGATATRHRVGPLQAITVGPFLLDIPNTSVIALWLGHETTKTTQIYLHADLALKQRALARTAPTKAATRRYRPPDTLLAFLEAI